MPGRLVFGSIVENHLTYNYKKKQKEKEVKALNL